MSSAYESAKRVALGLEAEVSVDPLGDDLWGISFDLNAPSSIRAEMPFQFFERGFEPPEEQTMQRAALMLYDDEYEADRMQADQNLAELESLLTASDDAGLSRMLDARPLAQWLSLIFLDGERLRNELVPLLKDADEACRDVFSAKADEALSLLVAFTDLLEVLNDCCTGV